MHQPIDDDDETEDLELTREEGHQKGCDCLRCFCMDLLESCDYEDELKRQEELKEKEGIPTVKDLIDWMP